MASKVQTLASALAAFADMDSYMQGDDSFRKRYKAVATVTYHSARSSRRWPVSFLKPDTAHPVPKFMKRRLPPATPDRTRGRINNSR